VTDNVGCSDSITKNVYIPKVPVAALSVNDTFGCIPLLIHFIDSSSVDDSTTIVSGHWSFGNGVSSATPKDTFYNYTSVGTYTATLVITDGYGCTDSAHQRIRALIPPAISVGPNVTICLGDTTTLTGSGSDTLLWVTNYNIDSPASGTPRVWPRVDTMYVLSVGSASTCFAYDTVHVSVSTITITLDTATEVCRNEMTVLNASAQTTHASITSYNWTYGDGTGSINAQTGSHQYPTYGLYMDTLIVINSIGCRDTTVKSVRIYDIPHAAFSLSIDSVCLGAPVTLTNLSTAGVSTGLSSFDFSLQGGVPDVTVSPATIAYPMAGSYRIVLVQTDSNACVDSAALTFVVHSLPRIDFNDPISCINVKNEYISADTPGDGRINLYTWTINGVPEGIDSNHIYHTFVDTGMYALCLSVSDIYGCVDTVCHDVQVFSNPLDTVSPIDTTICVGYSASFQITGPRFSHVQWVPSQWVSDPTGDSVTITPLQTIRYEVFSYFLQCQPKIDTVSIYVIDTLPVTASAKPGNIVLGLSSNVTSTVQGTIDSIVWSPDSTLNCRNCRNPIATPHETTTYTATIYYSKNGVTCSNQTTVTITVYPSCNNSLIYVANTFTPTSNDKNDVFKIQGIGIAAVNYLRVYDRWGKLVYDAENVDDPDHAAWNGGLNNDQNNPENSGVYVYVFEIQCTTGQTLNGKGNITLIR
jgi:gliding motility-associated-like protein